MFLFQQKGARPRVYKGHCSHVTNVRWTKDDKTLLSVGGMDATLLVWERVNIGQHGKKFDVTFHFSYMYFYVI